MIYPQDLAYCESRHNFRPLSTALEVELRFGSLREAHRQSMHKLVQSGTPDQKRRALVRRKNSLLEKLAELSTARELEQHFIESMPSSRSRGLLFDLGARAGQLRKIYLEQSSY